MRAEDSSPCVRKTHVVGMSVMLPNCYLHFGLPISNTSMFRESIEPLDSLVVSSMIVGIKDGAIGPVSEGMPSGGLVKQVSLRTVLNLRLFVQIVPGSKFLYEP